MSRTTEMEYRKYHKSPILQAVFELAYEERYWEMTIPGRFLAKVQAELPTRQDLKSTRFSITPNQPSFAREEIPHVRLSSSDGKRVVQIAPGSLAVSRLAPYDGWPDFKTTLLRYLAVLESLFSEQNRPALYRASLRYINRLTVQDLISDTKRQLCVYPAVPESLQPPPTTYLLHVLYPSTGDAGCLHLITGPSIPQTEADLTVFFELRFDSPLEGVARGSLVSWAETAHGVIENAFEKCITDDARRQFSQQ